MSAVAERALTPQNVVIAVDPHKASWTAVAVTAGLRAAAKIIPSVVAQALGSFQRGVQRKHDGRRGVCSVVDGPTRWG